MGYTYKYPRPAVTADAVVITKNERRMVLLILRANEPYRGCWAFPGGFMDVDETAEQCAFRELKEETGLQLSEAIQIGCYYDVNRDPRERTLSVAYLMLVDNVVSVSGQDDAVQAKWWPIDELPILTFDHKQIIDALKKTI